MSLKISFPKATPFIVLVALLLVIIYIQALSMRQGLRIENTIKATPVPQIVEPAASEAAVVVEPTPAPKKVTPVKVEKPQE